MSKLLMKQLANCLREMNRVNKTHREFLTAGQLAELGPVMRASLELVTELRGVFTTQL